MIDGVVYLLDEFHLKQAYVRMTSQIKDLKARSEAQKELGRIVLEGTKEEFTKYVDGLLEGVEKDSSAWNRITASRDYVLNQWEAARCRMVHKKAKDACGCHAEGHVYCVLSYRLSTRPMGWSITGLDRMSHLRSYYYNHGSMLKLIEMQPRLQGLRAAGAEDETILTLRQVIASEGHATETQKYAERWQASLATDNNVNNALTHLAWKGFWGES